MWEIAPRFTVGSQSPRGSYLVPLYKARGGPHVSMYVCISVQTTNGTPAIGSRTWATLANKWIAPRASAHSDHKLSMDLHARPDQVHPSGMAAIGFRTGATLANKWIARRPRFSAHSEHKHSKDLRARPDQLHPEPRAAQREAVELIPWLTVSRIGINGGFWGRPRFSATGAARGRRSKRVTFRPPNWCIQRIFGNA